MSTHPPALPVGKGAGRCAPVLPRRLFPRVSPVFLMSSCDCGLLRAPGLGSNGRVLLPSFLLSCVSGLWCRSSRLRSALVCRQAPCRFVLRFTAFRPRTPCFCNPLMVSQEQPDYVLSSVLKTDVSTAISAKSQGVRAFLDSHRNGRISRDSLPLQYVIFRLTLPACLLDCIASPDPFRNGTDSRISLPLW